MKTYQSQPNDSFAGIAKKFKIKDETGSVTVDGEGLEFYFDRVDEQRGGKMRYSETYLKHNDYMFLIGNASASPEVANVIVNVDALFA